MTTPLSNDAAAPQAGAAEQASLAGPPVLELRDAQFQIEDRTILFPLRLALQPGRMLGVIGHNGSGKSTLGRIMARQILPSKGELLVHGKPAQRIGSRQFARHVAYLPQHIPPASGMTVRELVALGRYPWLGAFKSHTPADMRQIEQSMATTLVSDLAQRLVDTLSGGERQRVWLAMLVAQQAQVLVLDEPTSALDIRHQVEVLSLLRHLARTHGISVVVILHDVYMAGRYCDELIALRQGRIVAAGDRDQILTPSALQAIYGVDMDVMIHPVSGDRVVCLGR